MSWTTHDVTNVVSELKDYNLYDTDVVLQEAVRREGAGWREAALHAHGQALGREATLRDADLANRHPPELQAFDRVGRRTDFIEFHEAWHRLMAMYREQGLISLCYADTREGRWAAQAAGMYLHGQIEAGSQCPATMTTACIPVLQQEGALFERIGPKLLSNAYDASDRPWSEKASVYIGMGMTEKQGGSDVRTNSSRAVPHGAPGRGQTYAIVGHKWFFSAPMCDAHLVLARAMDSGGAAADDPGQLSCFFVPRWRADGRKNAVHVQRLKDKLGNRSNSSSEVEFHDAEGILVGPVGKGIRTIIEMATVTRLHCVIGSAGQIRQALVQALHYARERTAFGKRLAEQPLMRSVLADMALESEAAAWLMMRLNTAFERVAGAAADPLERAWQRIVTPAAKFWVCKRGIELVAEAMEVFGGNGYVDTGPMARLYRDIPVNSIWEGSGNVMCLDVLRAIGHDPQGAQLLLEDLQRRSGGDARIAPQLQALAADLRLPPEAQEAHARRFTARLAQVVQAVLMLQFAPPAVADAFIATRLDAQWGRVFGMLPAGVDVAAVLRRAWPQ
jgi:putative acyl-CoA dehydrogenase